MTLSSAYLGWVQTSSLCVTRPCKRPSFKVTPHCHWVHAAECNHDQQVPLAVRLAYFDVPGDAISVEVDVHVSAPPCTADSLQATEPRSARTRSRDSDGLHLSSSELMTAEPPFASLLTTVCSPSFDSCLWYTFSSMVPVDRRRYTKTLFF